jgi:hypothetical protein
LVLQNLQVALLDCGLLSLGFLELGFLPSNPANASRAGIASFFFPAAPSSSAFFFPALHHTLASLKSTAGMLPADYYGMRLA